MTKKANHKHIYTPVLSCHRNSYRIGEGELKTSEIWLLIGKCTICGHHHEVKSYNKEFSWLDSMCICGTERLQELKEKYPIDEEYDFFNKKE